VTLDKKYLGNVIFDPHFNLSYKWKHFLWKSTYWKHTILLKGGKSILKENITIKEFNNNLNLLTNKYWSYKYDFIPSTSSTGFRYINNSVFSISFDYVSYVFYSGKTIEIGKKIIDLIGCNDKNIYKLKKYNHKFTVTEKYGISIIHKLHTVIPFERLSLNFQENFFNEIINGEYTIIKSYWMEKYLLEII
jgi:hypothetical protein